MREKIKVVSAILLFATSLTGALFLIEFPYSINGNGILLPEKEWELSRAPDGTVSNSLRDNLKHSLPSFSTTEFDRGDHSTFMLEQDISPNDTVSKGDTIGKFSSHQEELKLMELEKELSEQKKLLEISQTGEKPQRTRAAQEELRMAENDFETEKRKFERSKQLYERDVIADEKFDDARNALQKKEQEVRIARARYEDLTAGSKKEENERYKSAIRAIQKQIEITQKRLDELTIASPLSGKFTAEYEENNNDNEIVARVVSNGNMVFMMPVELSRTRFIRKGMEIVIQDSKSGSQFKGELRSIANRTRSIDGRQTVMTTSVIEDEEGTLIPGVKAESVMTCDTISAFRYLKRLIQTIFTH